MSLIVRHGYGLSVQLLSHLRNTGSRVGMVLQNAFKVFLVDGEYVDVGDCHDGRLHGSVVDETLVSVVASLRELFLDYHVFVHHLSL